jgi:hypothetical protein
MGAEDVDLKGMEADVRAADIVAFFRGNIGWEFAWLRIIG